MSRIPRPAFSRPRQSEPCPFGHPDDVSRSPEAIKPHAMVGDPEIQLIFKQFLKPDWLDNPALLLFIVRYVDCRNTSQASREAGISNGAYWRQKPEVHACIEAITSRMVVKYGFDGHEVIERVKEISNVDPVELENPDGTYKMLKDISPEVRRAIRKFKAKNIYGLDANNMRIVTGQLIEVEFWDKQRALELLGPEKNVLKKTTVVQHDVTSNMKDVLLESGNRAEERLRLMAAREVGDAGEASGSGDSGGSGDGVSERGGSGEGFGGGSVEAFEGGQRGDPNQGNEGEV